MLYENEQGHYDPYADEDDLLDPMYDEQAAWEQRLDELYAG